jgi:hypothetical protein
MSLEIPLYNPDSKDGVADWVEFYSALEENEISMTEVSSAIETYGGFEPEDSFMSDIWSELDRRQLLYGEKPPFIVDPSSVIPTIKWENNPEYMMCLLLSILGNSEDATATGKLFERLSSEAIKNYLGGCTIIYGHPSKQTVKDIANNLYERFNFPPSPNFKDRGLDVIGWKPFEDRRPSQVVILFQCAAGKNWKSKLRDLPIDAWCNYIAWGVKPIRGFILPQIVPHKEFEDCSCDAGVLIDRARIYRNTFNYDLGDELRDQIRIWCCNKISALRTES